MNFHWIAEFSPHIFKIIILHAMSIAFDPKTHLMFSSFCFDEFKRTKCDRCRDQSHYDLLKATKWICVLFKSEKMANEWILEEKTHTHILMLCRFMSSSLLFALSMFLTHFSHYLLTCWILWLLQLLCNDSEQNMNSIWNV